MCCTCLTFCRGTAYAVTEGLSHYDLPNIPSCAFGASSPYTVEPPLRRDCKTEKCSMGRGVKKFLLNFLTPQTTLVLTAESRHFATVFTRIQTRSRAKPTKIAVKCRIPDRHFTGAVKNIEFFYSPFSLYNNNMAGAHDAPADFICSMFSTILLYAVMFSFSSYVPVFLPQQRQNNR